jgi:hypothetical protein
MVERDLFERLAFIACAVFIVAAVVSILLTNGRYTIRAHEPLVEIEELNPLGVICRADNFSSTPKELSVPLHPGQSPQAACPAGYHFTFVERDVDVVVGAPPPEP